MRERIALALATAGLGLLLYPLFLSQIDPNAHAYPLGTNPLIEMGVAYALLLLGGALLPKE